MALLTGNIGNVFADTGDYPAASEYYHRALTLYEELGDRSGVALTTCCIGVVHQSTSDYSAALKHYHRALALYEELGERSGVAITTGNIGGVLEATGDYPAALEYFQRALSLYEDLGKPIGVASSTCGIVEVYIKIGSVAEARTLIATMDSMQIDEPGRRAEREQHRAALQVLDGDLEGAAMTLQRALTEALELGLRFHAADLHKALRDLAQKRNDFAIYIEHNNEYTSITEEINGKEATQKMTMQAKQREIDAREREYAKQLAVLHSTLPKHIADRVARGEVVSDHYDNTAVMFLDIVGFTTLSSTLTTQQVTTLLDEVFAICDVACKKHNVTRIKTIGDSYLSVAGVGHSVSESGNVCVNIANAAVEIIEQIQRLVIESPKGSHEVSPRIAVRIGLHVGPVTAGVLGKDRLQYDVWGDTVNVASRMENTSEPNRIHVSQSFKDSLEGVIPTKEGRNSAPGTWNMALRGETEIKGKGMMTTYWLQ